MSNVLKALTVAAIGFAAAASLTAAPAMAKEYCKVTIKVTNESLSTIKLLRVGFLDIQADKWRHDNIKNKKLGHMQGHSEAARLGGVGGEKFKMNLHYKVLQSGGKWSKTKKSAIKKYDTCKDGSTVEIVIR